MVTMVNINGVPVGLVPTGTDNVPVLGISERIQEEKISLQLWGEHLAGNLGRFVVIGGEIFSCSLVASDHRIFCFFTLKKNEEMRDIVRLYEANSNTPLNYWIGLDRFPEFSHVSLLQLLHQSARYKGIESLSHRFHEDPQGYSPFNLSGHRFSNEVFPVSTPPLFRSDISEEYAMQLIINQRFDSYFPNGIFNLIPAFPCRVGDDCMVMAFDFTNEIGECEMKVLKAYRIKDDHQLVKCYLPQTHWYCRGVGSFTAAVGLPGKQILFNLHLVLKADVVVVCTSLESALANQQINEDTETIAFTAFVCDGQRFDQVDFTPLEGKVVRVLVANHSGTTLAENYLEAQALYEYLRDEIKIEQIGFVQMAITYPDLADVYDIDALIAVHRRQKPYIIEGSVFELDESAFIQMLPRAEAEIERKRTESQDMPFWKNTESALCISAVNPTVSEKLTDKMIMRPFIVGGQITMIESAPGIGKTCLTTAICAQIVGSNAPFLSERCWTRCTPLDDSKRGYKVVYLTFDSDGAASISEHRTDFAGDLGEFDSNFIQYDMSGDMNNYTEEGNYNKFVDILKSFYAQGTDGQPVDVLVIDTLLSFAHGTVSNAHLMLRKLCEDFPDMAIVLIHHLNKANETYGGVKGTMFPRAILSLSRSEAQEPKGKRATLEDAFTINVEKSSMNKIPEDGESFAVKLDDKNHFVVVESVRTQEEMRKTLVEQYEKRYSLTQEEIGRLFGVTSRSIRMWK